MASLIRCRGKRGDVVYCTDKWKCEPKDFIENAKIEYEDEFGEQPFESSHLQFDSIDMKYLKGFGFPKENYEFEGE